MEPPLIASHDADGKFHGSTPISFNVFQLNTSSSSFSVSGQKILQNKPSSYYLLRFHHQKSAGVK